MIVQRPRDIDARRNHRRDGDIVVIDLTSMVVMVTTQAASAVVSDICIYVISLVSGDVTDTASLQNSKYILSPRLQ